MSPGNSTSLRAVPLYSIGPTRRTLCGCLAALLVACTGCGGSGQPRAAVSGTISVGGVPLEDGTISFRPTDGNPGSTAGGIVKDGQYSIPQSDGPVPGKNRVEIYGSRKTGKKKPNPVYGGQLMDEIVPVVPEQFNTHSTLKRELKAGKNVLNFELPAK
jgi:hypothetical protein